MKNLIVPLIAILWLMTPLRMLGNPEVAEELFQITELLVEWQTAYELEPEGKEDEAVQARYMEHFSSILGRFKDLQERHSIQTIEDSLHDFMKSEKLNRNRTWAFMLRLATVPEDEREDFIVRTAGIYLKPDDPESDPKSNKSRQPTQPAGSSVGEIEAF